MRRWIGWTALVVSLTACGAQRPKDDGPGPAPVERMELSDDGLRMEFAPRVEREDAVEHVLRCRLEEDPDNPRMSRVACPVNIGNAHIDVEEGPSGVALTVRLDLEDAKALKAWFEAAGRKP
jgi:hypothetical protein